MARQKLSKIIIIAILLLSVLLLFLTTETYILSFSFSFALPTIFGCVFPIVCYFAFGGRKAVTFSKENSRINIKSANKLCIPFGAVYLLLPFALLLFNQNVAIAFSSNVAGMLIITQNIFIVVSLLSVLLFGYLFINGCFNAFFPFCICFIVFCNIWQTKILQSTLSSIVEYNQLLLLMTICYFAMLAISTLISVFFNIQIKKHALNK